MTIVYKDDVELKIAVEVTGDAAVKNLGGEVQKTGEKAAETAPKFGDLRTELENLGAQESGVSGVFETIRENLGKLSLAIGGFIGVKLFGSSVDSAREFEAAMFRVVAASGATGEQLLALKAAAENAGASTQYTSVEAANALENLAKAGLSAADAVATLPAVLDLATAGSVDLATASDYIAKAVAGLGLSFSDAGRVADVLAKGANASNTSVDGLAQALSYAAPLASSLGLSLEQTVAIIGKFADAGIDAGRAGTALNSILAQFSDPASKFRRGLADAGIVTTDFDRALRQLADAGPAGQSAILAVGQEAGPALRALLNQGIGALDSLKQQLDDSAGSAQAFAAVMSANLDGASKGLGSAWDALKIKLGEPILAPLKTQVDQLANDLRAFVASGTATQFGESIAAGFQAAALWARGFIAEIDFSALATKMKAFAADAATVFDDFGQKAVNAGNIAKTSYGVMAAGFNTVLAAVYRMGKGLAWVTSAMLADLASIMEGIDAITPDVVTEKFKRGAAALREESRAAAAVMEEFGKKSTAAFDDAATAAEVAQQGWQALTTPVADAGRAAELAGQQLGAAATQAGLSADQLDALGEGAEYASGELLRAGVGAEQLAASTATIGPSAAEAAAKIAALRGEYARLIELGDTQGAAEVLVQLQVELDKTQAKAEGTAEAVEGAFRRLGVASTASLKQAADTALSDFSVIREAGTSSAADIEAAFTAYAEKAIAANGGVADEMLKAQAAQVGMKITADEAGKVIVRSMKEASEATAQIAKASEDTAAGMGELGEAAATAADSADGLTSSMTSAGDATRSAGTIIGAVTQQEIIAYRDMDKARESYVRNMLKSHNDRINAAESEGKALERLARQQEQLNSSAARGVDDLKLRLIELNGTEDEIAQARLERDKADVNRQIALLELEAKRAMVRGESGEAPRLREEIRLLEEQLVLIDKVFKAEQRNAQSKDKPGSSTGGGSSTGDRSGGTAPKGGTPPRDTAPLRTVQVNLNLGGKTFPVFSDEATADKLLRDLETLQRVSS